MNARKYRKYPKEKKITTREKSEMLQDIFPDISHEVVQLLLENCNGDVDKAHDHLREMDLENWAAKNIPSESTDSSLNSVIEEIDQSITHEVDATSRLRPSRCDVSLLSDSQSLSSATNSSSPPMSLTDVQVSEPLLQEPISPEVVPDVSESVWTGESSSDFALSSESDQTGGMTEGAEVYQEGENSMQLTLDKDLAVRLIMTFGLMGVPIDCNERDNMVVDLDMNLAYKIYQAWKNTQESVVMQQSPESVISADEKLARCLQTFEHETYAERSLRENSMREIMDETYALSLVEKDSNGHGMDVTCALQYQSNGGVESKWVDVLMRAHNKSPETGYAVPDSTPKNVHAVGPVLHGAGIEKPLAKLESAFVRPSSAKTIVVTPVSSHARQSPVGNGLPKKGPVDPVDYYGARGEAIELQKKAIHLGRKAGNAWKLGGGASAYYLQQSHETKKLAKEAHLEASKEILHTRNLNAGDGEIDLHGIRMEEVNHALDTFFERRHTVKEIKIISGRGLHSRSGTSEVRRMVGVYLNKHGFKYEEGPPEGVFYVQRWKKSNLKPP
ncbi:hypothetical protein BV898_11888 [Hypsibius exemplaris]|uniref:Smr domain-containing protein n=1 Tax=Hypsibius exemplaris TaxID=2072580 RepID=A0A1W0WFC1_HYPEX|nr:hypothetical protein BV898_11888 [Hypsibius exemplaris]